MLHKLYLLFFFISLFAGVSCTSKTPDQKRTALLEVEGRFLYLDQVQEIIPPNVGEADSVQIAGSYIRKWATDVLLYENAKRNIPDKTEIDRLMEDYRKSLIIHQYQQRLLQQRLPAAPGDAEILTFYNEFPEQFRVQETLIKGRLLIVPAEAPRIANARSWMQTGGNKSLEQIEKYSMQHALSFDYFGDRWVPLTDILRKIPIQVANPADHLASARYYEISDSLRHYMLGVDSIVRPGQAEPFALAKEKISNIMLNKMKTDFISSFQDELYNDAVKDGTITFFNQ